MHSLMRRLTALAVLSTALSFAPVVTTAFAAQPAGQVDCNDPAMKNDPACLTGHKPGFKNRTTTPDNGATNTGGSTTTNTGGSTTTTTTTNGSQTLSLSPNGNNDKKPIFCPGGGKPQPDGSCPPLPRGPSNGTGHNDNNNNNNNNNNANNGPSNGPGGFFNFSPQQHDQFRQRFRSFNFGTFALPGFSITLGTPVPHHYRLRPVPYSIYHYYPQFRGYLFFATRDGDIVIVSPRTYRIVAII